MRLSNGLILTLYILCMAFDIFSDNGSGFFRTITFIMAIVDFALFGYVIITRLSNYLGFPILSLPKNLKPQEDNKQNEQTNSNKLESSIEVSGEVRVDLKDEEHAMPNYPVDLEFDNESNFPAPFKKPSDLEFSNKEEVKAHAKEEEEKEGDVSYNNDFDDDDYDI